MLAEQLNQEISELIKHGDYDAADRKLSGLSDDSGVNPAEQLLLKGRLLIHKGQQDEAADVLEDAVRGEPADRDLMFDVAYEADLHGHDDIAIELLEKLVKKPPLHVNALINLAVLYEDEGSYGEAEVCLLKVLDHYPEHPRAMMFIKDVQSSQSMYYDEDYERSREKHHAVLDIPISDFELSVRSRNCLRKMNIATLGDLLKTTEAELLSYKNFGETSLNEIKAMLRQKGLHLGQALEEDIFDVPQPAGAEGPGQASLDSSALNKPVSELELSVRARKCLQRLGIATLGELHTRTENELLSSKNFGQTSLNEIKLRLAENGLSLRKSDVRT